MNKYSTRNIQGVHKIVFGLLMARFRGEDGDDGGRFSSYVQLSLCLEARVCGQHYTITLYCAVLCCTEGDGVGGGL